MKPVFTSPGTEHPISADVASCADTAKTGLCPCSSKSMWCMPSRASVILKSKDAIRAQAEDVCTRCDYASLDSMLGNEWDWEALDNAEGRGILLSTIEETWEGISQHLSDRLDATGTLQRDTNEELISALHDVMRPSRQASSQPQIWPFVKRVTVDMKLVSLQ